MSKYKKWTGHGRIAGRDDLMVIDENGNDVEVYPRDRNPAAWDDIGTYVPLPGKPKVRFVVRWEPLADAKPPADPDDEYLQLLLAGEWNAAARVLESLKFQSETGELPLKSSDEIKLHTRYWTAYGTVLVDSILMNGKDKLYAKVMFRNKDDPKVTVAAYWCWPL